MSELFYLFVTALVKLIVLILVVFSFGVVAVMAWQVTKGIVEKLPKPLGKFLFPVIFILLLAIGVFLFG